MSDWVVCVFANRGWKRPSIPAAASVRKEPCPSAVRLWMGLGSATHPLAEQEAHTSGLASPWCATGDLGT